MAQKVVEKILLLYNNVLKQWNQIMKWLKFLKAVETKHHMEFMPFEYFSDIVEGRLQSIYE